MNTETTGFPYTSSQQCTRCGSEEEVNEDRFQYAMFDSAESSGESASGNLCFPCFREVKQFVNGEH